MVVFNVPTASLTFAIIEVKIWVGNRGEVLLIAIELWSTAGRSALSMNWFTHVIDDHIRVNVHLQHIAHKTL